MRRSTPPAHTPRSGIPVGGRASRVPQAGPYTASVATIPLTVTCECGACHSAELGDAITCSCGRHYETSELDQGRLTGVRLSQARMRLYITFGVIFIVAVSALTAAVWSLRGIAVGAPLAGLLWFRVVGPYFRSRVFDGAGELPRWKLEAEKAPAEK